MHKPAALTFKDFLKNSRLYELTWGITACPDLITDNNRAKMTVWFRDKYKPVLNAWLPFSWDEIAAFKNLQWWTSCQFKRSDIARYQQKWCYTDCWKKEWFYYLDSSVINLLCCPSSAIRKLMEENRRCAEWVNRFEVWCTILDLKRQTRWKAEGVEWIILGDVTLKMLLPSANEYYMIKYGFRSYILLMLVQCLVLYANMQQINLLFLFLKSTLKNMLHSYRNDINKVLPS